MNRKRIVIVGTAGVACGAVGERDLPVAMPWAFLLGMPVAGQPAMLAVSAPD